jgi:hypothetical protein
MYIAAPGDKLAAVDAQARMPLAGAELKQRRAGSPGDLKATER